MGGDNTYGMKKERVFKRLMVAILDKLPDDILLGYLEEYRKEGNIDASLQDMISYSKNFEVYYQQGKPTLISVFSTLSKQGRLSLEKNGGFNR